MYLVFTMMKYEYIIQHRSTKVIIAASVQSLLTYAILILDTQIALDLGNNSQISKGLQFVQTEKICFAYAHHFL